MKTQTKSLYPEAGNGTVLQKIVPFLWFDNNAEDAVNFYVSVFRKSGIINITRYGETGARMGGRPAGSVMTISFRIEDQEFQAINGGPMFKITPAISFFVNCISEAECEDFWKKLLVGGTVLMDLDRYPFSEKFGWLKDKFGVNWQLNHAPSGQKIATYLVFTGNQAGKAEEAINYYVTVFENSSILQLDRYEKGAQGGGEGTVRFSKFTLMGQEFMAIDSNYDHQFNFTPGLSLLVKCDNQEEIDFLWDKLTKDGDVNAQQCGWLQDKYGVSWQIIPVIWEELISKADGAKTEKLMAAILKMKKLDIQILQKVYNEP